MADDEYQCREIRRIKIIHMNMMSLDYSGRQVDMKDLNSKAIRL